MHAPDFRQRIGKAREGMLKEIVANVDTGSGAVRIRKEMIRRVTTISFSGKKKDSFIITEKVDKEEEHK